VAFSSFVRAARLGEAIIAATGWVIVGCSGGIVEDTGAPRTHETGTGSPTTTGDTTGTTNATTGNASGAGGAPSSGSTGGTGGPSAGGAGGATGGRGGAPADAGRPDTSSGTGGAVGDAASPGCGKRGYGSPFTVSSAPQDLAALSAPVPGVSWLYGWSRAPSSQVGMSYVAAGVEWVPMIWGHADELSDANLASRIQVGPGTKYLLGYNEPNFTAQSNLTPAQAAAGWPFLQKAADQLGLKTVAPAVNFCGGGCNQTDPFVWLDQFLAACTNCRIDYVAFHSYACDSNWFLNTYISKAIDKYYTHGTPPRKLWITELACADSAPAGGWSVAQVESYMKAVVPWLESQPAVFRYSWFGDNTGRPTGSYVTPSNALLAGPGQLTPLGVTYTTLPASSVCP
jgi:hypothetical protein